MSMLDALIVNWHVSPEIFRIGNVSNDRLRQNAKNRKRNRSENRDKNAPRLERYADYPR